MRKLKRTEITIETREVVRIHRPGRMPLTYCSACDDLVPMTSVSQAAAIAGVLPESIHERVERNTVHHIETSGQSLICLNSLMS